MTEATYRPASHRYHPLMRILGIDPGLRTTGFGVVDEAGGQLSYVASGTISTQHLDTHALPARLKVLFDGIGEVVQRYQPDCAAVEIVFVNVNPQSTLLLGQARGALITALVSQNLPVAEYTALQMKQAVAIADFLLSSCSHLVDPTLQLPHDPIYNILDYVHVSFFTHPTTS